MLLSQSIREKRKERRREVKDLRKERVVIDGERIRG